MKQIALFGGSGKTGQHFLEKAVEAGYEIKALLRSPGKIITVSKNLSVIQGDILNEQDVEKTIAGTDVVVNLSGHVKDSPADLQLRSSKFIISSMKRNGIKRLITLTGAGVRDEKNDKPRFIDKLVVFIMKYLAGKKTREMLNDARNNAEYLMSRSDIDYTIVRAPRLNNQPASHKLEAGYVGRVNGLQLSREDLAEFILQELAQNNYVGKMPFVTNG